MEVVERSYYAQIADDTVDTLTTPKQFFFNNFVILYTLLKALS